MCQNRVNRDIILKTAWIVFPCWQRGAIACHVEQFWQAYMEHNCFSEMLINKTNKRNYVEQNWSTLNYKIINESVRLKNNPPITHQQ